MTHAGRGALYSMAGVSLRQGIFAGGRLPLLADKDALGFGYRSWRYAMVVDDGQIAAWFEEPGINGTGDDATHTASARRRIFWSG
jgi:peroxiredoxin